MVNRNLRKKHYKSALLILSLFTISLRQFTGAPNVQISFLTDSQSSFTVAHVSDFNFEGDQLKSQGKSKPVYKHYVGPKEFQVTKDKVSENNFSIKDLVQDRHFKIKAIKIAKRANSPPSQIKLITDNGQNLMRKGILVLDNENKTNYVNWRFSQY